MNDKYNIYRGRYKEFIESKLLERPGNIKFNYSECHHIIPRCLGGTWDDGYVYLDLKEHFIAHKILVEENPNLPCLSYALWRMSNDGRYTSPEDYEIARSRVIELLSNSEIPEEVRSKMSVSAKLRASDNSYKEKFVERMLNSHTEETRRKISSSHIGKRLSETTKLKISKAKLGHEVSGETRKKLSDANKLENLSEETKKKRAESILRRSPVSDETRKKMSSSHKGNKSALGYRFTEEQKLRVSENRKGLGPIDYHLICISCGEQFISKGPRGKYCSDCKLKRF